MFLSHNLSAKVFLYIGTFLAFFLLFYALVSQHIGGYEPCVRCIYQRMAILTIALGGIVSLSHNYCRPIGLSIVLIAATVGFMEAHTHAGVIAGTVEDFCSFRPKFGFLGPLDEWMPWFFRATGDCADDHWHMLGFNMPQWIQFACLNFAVFSFAMLGHWFFSISKKTKNT